jgi:hypothetical protein
MKTERLNNRQQALVRSFDEKLVSSNTGLVPSSSPLSESTTTAFSFSV